MSDPGPTPPASGLARSLRRLFDGSAGEGAGPPTAGEGPAPNPVRRSGHVQANGLPREVRERFTNRLARYLRTDAGERDGLVNAFRADVAQLLAAGETGPLADAVLVLASASEPTAPEGAPDPLLPIVLSPEVTAELERRDTPRARAILPLLGQILSRPSRPERRSP